MTDQVCLMCPATFPPVRIGGRDKMFCSKECRAAFHYACRNYAAAKFQDGEIGIDTLRRFARKPTFTLQGGVGSADQVL